MYYLYQRISPNIYLFIQDVHTVGEININHDGFFELIDDYGEYVKDGSLEDIKGYINKHLTPF